MNMVLPLMVAVGAPMLESVGASACPLPLTRAQNFSTLGITLAVILVGSLITTRFIAPRLSEKQRWIWQGTPVWLSILLVQCVPMALGWRPFDSSVLGISLGFTGVGMAFGVWLQNRTWPPRQVPAPPPARWPSDRPSA